jgi:hypothetical protein
MLSRLEEASEKIAEDLVCEDDEDVLDEVVG